MEYIFWPIILPLAIACILMAGKPKSIALQIITSIIFTVGVGFGALLLFVIIFDLNPYIAFLIPVGASIVWVLGNIAIFRSHGDISNKGSVMTMHTVASQQTTNEQPIIVEIPAPTEKKTINNLLEKINIGWKKWCTFYFSNGESARIQSQNLCKIAHKIIEDHRTNVFQPKELHKEFVFIRDHYQSLFDQATYQKILRIVERFVDEGGRVEIM